MKIDKKKCMQIGIPMLVAGMTVGCAYMYKCKKKPKLDINCLSYPD